MFVFIHFKLKKMNKIILIFSILFVFCVTGFSQNTISGKTINIEQEILVGTHIHIGSKTVSSNSDGNYSIKNLPTGATKIYVSYLGYQPIDTIVNLSSDMNLDFILKLKTAKLDEVVVKHIESNVTKSILEQKIKIETIEKYSNKSLGDALKEVAGVSSLKTGSTVVKPIINGLYGSRVPVLNNNVRLEDQEWGTEHAPNFDINAAGKITVIKGASGLQYSGDAVGGLVIIEPMILKKDTLLGKSIFNFDSNGRGGSLSSSLHKGNYQGFSWNALATFKYLGDRKAPNYVLSNTGNREANFTGDLKYSGQKYDVTSFYSYYSAKIGILSASHTGSATDLFNSINNKIPFVINDFTFNIKNPKQDVKHHIAKVSANYIFDEATSLSFQYAFQFNKRLEFDVRRKSFENIPALDLELKTHAVNLDFKKMQHDWGFKTGISTSLQSNVASPLTDIRPLIPTYNKSDFGIYSIISHRFSDKFSMDAGLRFDFTSINATKYYFKSRWDERDYNAQFANIIAGDFGLQWLTKPKFNFQNVSASAGFLKDFEKDLKWFVNMSLATRNPNPSEFFSDGLHHATGFIELGDLGLKKEQSIKLSTTLQKKWSKFNLEVNPYLNTIQNFIFLKPIDSEFTNRGTFPVGEYQQTNARLIGLDLETRWNLSEHWFQTFAMAYVNGRDVTKKLSLIDMPPFNMNSKIQFTKKEWYDLLLELKGDIVFRQTRFPNNNFDINIVVNGNLEPRTVDISTPPEAYNLLHFYSEMKFKTFKSSFTTVAFSIQNILNTNYRDYLNKQRFFADETGRNIQIQLKINY
jgi:iron complex outermembrane recepter protein